MANPLFPGDPMADYRRMMAVTRPKPPFDPLAEYRRTMAAVKPIDPMAEYRRMMAAVRATKPPFDPLAEYRRTMAAVKPIDPMAEYRRMIEAVHFDPLAEYRRVLQQFSEIASATLIPSGEHLPSREPAPEPSSLVSLPNAALVNTLFGIAWTCLWMIAHGASVEDLGSVLSAALGLVLYFQKGS